MSKEPEHIVRYQRKPLTSEQIARIDALARQAGRAPSTFPTTPKRGREFFKDAPRGEMYRLVKRQITLRLDADILDWFKRRTPAARATRPTSTGRCANISRRMTKSPAEPLGLPKPRALVKPLDVAEASPCPIRSSIPAHAIPAASALRRSRFRWRIVAFVALVVAILALGGRFATEIRPLGRPDRAGRDRRHHRHRSRPGSRRSTTLAKNDSVKAVMLAINSPGGTTAGGEELYEALGKLRAKKPVVAYINELGASAAYMTAIAADRIFARRLSIVGSIGVLFQTYNAGKLLDTIGIGSDKVSSGPLKAEPDHRSPDDARSARVAAIARRRQLLVVRRHRRRTPRSRPAPTCCRWPTGAS